MAITTAPLPQRAAWNALAAHYRQIKGLHMRELFAKDPKRGERLAAEAAGVYLDYSKNRITDETLDLLLQLAKEAGLRARTDAMFGGEKINASEKRAVLHVALRAPKGQSILVDGDNVVPSVHAVLDRMADFAGEPERRAGSRWQREVGSLAAFLRPCHSAPPEQAESPLKAGFSGC